MLQFSCRTEIVSGPGAMEALKRFRAGRAMVVTDGYFSKSGQAGRLAALAAPEFEIFDEVRPDPELTLIARGAARVRDYAPELLIALGGGSVLDAAKAMGHFSGLRIPLAAIPTTSGSGSEVTDFAILTHQGVKHPLVDPALAPDLAILDESLLTSLPRGLVADTGFDVLSHALEALAATGAGPITDALAREAFLTAYSRLPASFAGDTAVRGAVHMASAMSAMAFNRAGLGICHSLSHALGGRYHVPHGRLNAVLLPAVLQANAPAAGEKYAAMARLGGFGGSGTAMAVRNLKSALCRLRRQLQLPGTLAAAGIEPRQLRRDMDELIGAALEDRCSATNPVPPDKVLLWQVLEEAAGHG